MAVRLAIIQYGDDGMVLQACTTMVDRLPVGEGAVHRLLAGMWVAAARYAEVANHSEMKPAMVIRPYT